MLYGPPRRVKALHSGGNIAYYSNITMYVVYLTVLTLLSITIVTIVVPKSVKAMKYATYMIIFE